MKILHFFIFLIVVYSEDVICFEPILTQLVWKSDLEIGPQADFLVKAEPVRFAEGPLGISFNLQIYGEKDGKEYLAFEDKGLGTQLYGIFQTGQIDSPLIVVSSQNGRYKTVNTYYFDKGKIKKGFELDSVLFPEILIRKSGGLIIMIAEIDENKELKSRNIFYYQKKWVNTEQSKNRDLLRSFGRRFDGLDQTTNN